jgi:hypothetical protein
VETVQAAATPGSEQAVKPTIEQRLVRLEQKAFDAELSGHIPGTMLQRTLLGSGSTESVGWTLCIGGMMQPKENFRGDTIEEVLDKAEAYLLAMPRRKP